MVVTEGVLGLACCCWAFRWVPLLREEKRFTHLTGFYLPLYLISIKVPDRASEAFEFAVRKKLPRLPKSTGVDFTEKEKKNPRVGNL